MTTDHNPAAEKDAWAEVVEEHWHSVPSIGPYRCRGCNGSQVVLTDAQVAALNSGMPTSITREQWQAVHDRARISPPGAEGGVR